jgi:penicillin amidase
VRRIAALVVLLVVVAVVAVGGLLAALTAGGQPQLSGTRSVPGLGSQVSIVRDENGISQISAGNAHDLFFAQGWVHASERLWQMEIFRRIGAGRLSELFGPSQLATDKFIRTLDWRGAAARDFAVLSDNAKAILAAYADGVNAFVAGHPDDLGLAWVVAGLKSGITGDLTGLRPEPWTAIDTLTFAKLQGWGLGGNMDTEIFRMLEDQQLGSAALTDELFPAYSADQPVIAGAVQTGAASGATSGPASATAATATKPGGATGTASTTSVASSDSIAWAELARVAGGITALAGLTPQRDLANDGGVGSNNWVVSGAYTASGKPMLANDPHLGFNMPSIWYVNGLHCRPVSTACPYDVAGVTFAGTPGVVAGHNANIAWGVTNANPDVQDLVMEKVDPADPSKYITATGSAPFTTRQETIKVAGEADVVLTVRETSHGPIINDADGRLTGSANLLALRWTALAVPDRVMEAFIGVDAASNWTEFRDALRMFGAPSQNFVYADVNGHIGYQLPGNVPVRTDPADQGLRPVPGWDGKHEWTGYVPFDALPSVYDPPSGRLVTANNAIDGGSVFLGAEYDRGDRAARITEMLDAAKGSVTAATIASIQGDTLMRRAARMTSALRSMNPTPTTADGKAVLDQIYSWDQRCTTTSTGCSAYLTFELELERAIFDNDLSSWARDYVTSDWANDLAATLVGTPAGRASKWWANPADPNAGDAAAVTAGALDVAGTALRRELGDPSSWAWGRIHQIAFKEQTLGSSGIGPIEWYFSTSPSEVNGAAGAVDNNYYRVSRAYTDPTDPSYIPVSTLKATFAVTNGPSMRAIYDLSNLDASRIVTTTGQSGQPFSIHNTDFIAKWLRNETVPLPFSDAAVAKATSATLLLVPAP